MADILLTHSNHLRFDAKQARKMEPYPPLQTLIAAACLQREGFEAELFDSTFLSPEQGFREALDRLRPRLVVLCEDNFNFLTKMCLTRNRELAFAMLREAKRRGLPAVVNGSDAADHVADYLDAGADDVIVGEVEITLVELARRLLGDGDAAFETIAGLAYRDPSSGQPRYTAARKRLDDLDQLPRPAWELIDIEAYRSAWVDRHGYFSLNIVSSRGCPYRCNWCAKPIYGDAYSRRSPESVAEEMLYLKREIAPDRLWFADDIFALSAHWTEDFASAVERLDAKIPFKMQTRCDLMTGDLAAALGRAGCAEVWMGVESGSQDVLDAMEKGSRVDDIRRARKNLRRFGIRAGFFLQFGYPGETWDDIQRTIRLVRETEPDDVGISVSYPLPGTKFYDRVRAEMGAKQNWSESDDLDMMFSGAYTSEFYRALRDALHFEVECRNRKTADGHDEQHLRRLWLRVEQLEKTCANPNAIPQWTCC